jgi:hypothetical protein
MTDDVTEFEAWQRAQTAAEAIQPPPGVNPAQWHAFQAFRAAQAAPPPSKYNTVGELLHGLIDRVQWHHESDKADAHGAVSRLVEPEEQAEPGETP